MRVGGAGYGGPIACGGAHVRGLVAQTSLYWVHVRGLVADVALLGDIGRSQMGEGIPRPGAHCWLLRLSPFQATLLADHLVEWFRTFVTHGNSVPGRRATQVPLCASRSAPAAAARPCASLVSLLPPPPPPPPSPPPVGAARVAARALVFMGPGI